MSDIPPNTEAIFKRFYEELLQAPANGRDPLFHVDELIAVAERPIERMLFAKLCRQYINDPERCELVPALIRILAAQMDSARHNSDSWASFFEKIGVGGSLSILVGTVLKFAGVVATASTSVFFGLPAFAIYSTVSLLATSTGFFWFRKKSRKQKHKVDVLLELAKLIEAKFAVDSIK